MFQKILIANRGEIAVRVIRACRELGIKTVAVYSDVDRDALHVRYADEAYHCGPPPAAESYLRGDLIVEIAKRAGAEAIHPGYGFLAENGDFADLCDREGIVFIGPKGDVMRKMGDKVTARQTMEAAKVPIVPGTQSNSLIAFRLRERLTLFRVSQLAITWMPWLAPSLMTLSNWVPVRLRSRGP